MENASTQTYRYKIKYWLLFIIWGILCEGMVAGTLIKNSSDLLAGKFSTLDYVGFAFVIFVFFPFGVLSFAVPFSAKIVLSPQGVEFHTISSITKANWSDLSIGLIQTQSNVSKTLVSSQSDVTLRSWAKYLPWDVTSGIRELGIPFSQFGIFTSQKLLASINLYAPFLNIHE
jgi:hypothetical protein